jgi:DNA/RNA-binding protein KIN17
MSKYHQCQLLPFAENAHNYTNNFSEEFEIGYLELLKREFGTERVHANRVYQDYISERHHLHMNSTQWENYSMFLRTFFSEKDDFERETKIVPREKNTVKVKEALRKVTIFQIRGNHVGNRR